MATYDCSDAQERADGLREAADAIRHGLLVVLPTDTVYGVGADAFTPSAVDLLLTAKGRGREMPVPVLVDSRRMLDGIVDALSMEARDLADAFWPGPLTLVLRHTPSLSWDLGDTRGTVAVRVPLHPVALDLIAATGPLAVSSANRTGFPPATTVEQAREQLADDVVIFLDGGACESTTPSSIVDCTGDRLRVLRLGALDADTLRSVVPDLEVG
jgi:tRNA threonylcarbamoyl adenosine modification protein (Sua5/YciO/YrdC/YwlC family)